MTDCDVLVVGKELCGYAAAAISAHAGRKVIMLDDDEDGGTKALGDYLVPTAPALWSLPQTGNAAKLMDKLGLRQKAREEFGAPTGIGLIDDPDVRMTLFTDPHERLVELMRVFHDGEKYHRFFQGLKLDRRDALLEEAGALESEGWFSGLREKKRKVSYGDAVRFDDDESVRHFGSEGLGAALPQMAPLVQSLLEPPQGLSGFLSIVQLQKGASGDTARGFGLRGSLRALFAEVITGHGGEFKNGAVVGAKGSKKIDNIQTAKETFNAKIVVDATTLRSLTQRLPEGSAKTKTRALENAVPFAGASAVVRWLVPAKALPAGLAARTVILSDTPTSPPILLGCYRELPDLKGKRTPTGHVALVAVAHSRSLDSEGVASAIDARMQALLPFVKEGALVSDQLIGNDARVAMPAYAAAGDVHLLLGRKPKTAFKNVIRAGRDLVPALGFAGELAAARSVSLSAEIMLGNKRPQMVV